MNRKRTGNTDSIRKTKYKYPQNDGTKRDTLCEAPFVK